MAAAASAGGIAEAMSRANNSAQMAGVSMNKYIGYLTTIMEVTQKSESSVGESMKTVKRMRLCGIIHKPHRIIFSDFSKSQRWVTNWKDESSPTTT